MQFFNDCFLFEFNSDICVKVMYTKKDKFATKIAFVEHKLLPQPQQLYTGMPVMPVTNYRSEWGPCHQSSNGQYSFKYCRSPDFKKSNWYNKKIWRGTIIGWLFVCLFVWLFETLGQLGITASSHSKCCPADKTRPDQSRLSI